MVCALEGPYHAFAGREIARSLALFSLEEEDIGSAELEDLDEEDHRSLEEWTAKFRKRYKKVAEVKTCFLIHLIVCFQLKERRLRLSRVVPMASMAASALAIAVLMNRA